MGHRQIASSLKKERELANERRKNMSEKNLAGVVKTAINKSVGRI